jgi:hypothetical protein
MMNDLDALETNYRVDSRYPPRPGARASCWPQSTPPTSPDLALSLLDLTDIGVGLVVSEPVARGEAIRVTLLAPAWAEPVSRLGLVVWSETSDHDSRIGVIFASALTFLQLQDLCYLGQPSVAGAPPATPETH